MSDLRLAEVEDFIDGFYATSDDAARDDEWVDYFTPDATVIMGDKTARGTEQIRALRRSMWEKVQSRRHSPEKKIFTHDGPELEYMLYGSLDLVMKTGEEVAAAWSCRAVLTEGPGESPKFQYSFYQVYIQTPET
ncbi:hypothetical protein GGR56DRAFT_672148 [Xylariaceae sp. FL0804]|nr:hypothetical protein GGR56DRAFT_672148 [Xylariaceae sp. FL0804]